MTAQKGFRGLLMAWIVVFHCTMQVAAGNQLIKLNLQANSLMTFFFILSGFSLAVGYAKTNWAEADGWQVLAFYRNRFARLMPAYYLTMALAIPLFLMGHGVAKPTSSTFWSMFVSNVLCIQQWVQGVPKLFGAEKTIETRPFNPPTWFVSVLVFLYLAFPYVISGLQALSHAGLVRMVCVMYWLNVAACSAMAVLSAWLFTYTAVSRSGVQVYRGRAWAAFKGIAKWRVLWPQVRNSSRVFWASTSWPLVRLPVFLMGAAAGLCVVHGRNPFSTAEEDDEEEEAGRWAVRTDLHFVVFLLCALVAGMLANIRIGGEAIDIGFNWWGQVLMCYSQTVIIVGLCKDDGLSCLSSLCGSPVLQFLGEIGMEWFLVHQPMVQYLKVLTRPEEKWLQDPTIPLWGVPIVFLASLAAAYVMHYWFAEPLRKRLRAPKQAKKGIMDTKPSA